MRIRVGFMLNHRSKNEHVLQDKCCNQEQGGHTDVQGHSEIPQRQSRRNNTACVKKVGKRVDSGRRDRKKGRIIPRVSSFHLRSRTTLLAWEMNYEGLENRMGWTYCTLFGAARAEGLLLPDTSVNLLLLRDMT